MYVVLGGTGRVGSAAVRALASQGLGAVAVSRQPGPGRVVADVRDLVALRQVLERGTRAIILNPPAAPSTDPDAEERANVDAILRALEGSRFEKVVVVSTYGAREGIRCGDLTVLHELEERVQALGIPCAINHGA